MLSSYWSVDDMIVPLYVINDGSCIFSKLSCFPSMFIVIFDVSIKIICWFDVSMKSSLLVHQSQYSMTSHSSLFVIALRQSFVSFSEFPMH